MPAVVSARKIRDRMPRWLWEIRPECGHFHYELADKIAVAPVSVMCRVCQAEARLVAYRARVAERTACTNPRASRIGDVELESISAIPPMPFELDGGLCLQGGDLADGVSSKAEASETPPASPGWGIPSEENRVSSQNLALEAPGGSKPLPACMREHPEAPLLKRPDLRSEPLQEGAKWAKRAKPAPKGKGKDRDSAQQRLFQA